MRGHHAGRIDAGDGRIDRGPPDGAVDLAVPLGRHEDAQGVRLIRSQHNSSFGEHHFGGHHLDGGGGHQPAGRGRLNDALAGGNRRDRAIRVDGGDLGLERLPLHLADGDGVPSSFMPCGVIVVRLTGKQHQRSRIEGQHRAGGRGAPPGLPRALAPGDQDGQRGPPAGRRASTLARPGLTPTTVPSGPTLAMRVSELQKTNLADWMRLPCRS